EVVEAWPSQQQQDKADTVVFMGDKFTANPFPEAARNLADLHKMMTRGCGIVCIHYATGLKKEDVSPSGEHPLLGWMGGYFANPGSVHHVSYARIFDQAKITPGEKEHPVLRGWKEFVIRDEPYGNNYFGTNKNKPAPNVTILATSLQPPEAPKRETVAWCVQRADQGRGFGVVMPHFYKNWANDDLRTFVLNGIVWTTRAPVPEDGVRSLTPDLKSFEPKSVEPK
ncbi:MAG: ThuA domain-containing protein, partial [Planctomycetota bacterium]|nr:ThuA domain-containing protein [Planctomycetota bacterium]